MLATFFPGSSMVIHALVITHNVLYVAQRPSGTSAFAECSFLTADRHLVHHTCVVRPGMLVGK